MVEPSELGGYGCDALLLDDFQHTLQALLTGERAAYYGDFGRLSDFAKSYAQRLRVTGQVSSYRGCRWGADSGQVSADRLVAFASNHDTIGNRPGGERLGRLVNFEELKLAATATILSPTIPFLFMGDEYDDPAPFYFFTSHIDPALAAAVRAGREREFAEHGWPTRGVDPQSFETFTASRLTRSLAPRAAMPCCGDFIGSCCSFGEKRRRFDNLTGGTSRVDVFEDRRALIAKRHCGTDVICMCLNFGESNWDVSPHISPQASWRIVLDSSESRWRADGESASEQTPCPGSRVAMPKACLLLAANLAGEEHRR